MQYIVAWWSGIVLIGIILLHLALFMEVLRWWF